MPRRVPVELTLGAAEYLAEARKVEVSTKAMDTQMGALDRAVDKVERDMGELAATTAVAKRQVDDLGDKARGTAADLSLLDARIKAARASARELGLEFARTGDVAALGERRKELSLAAQLERLRKEIEKAGDGGSLGVTLGSAAGTRAGQGFTSSFGEALSSAGGKWQPILITSLVGAAIAAAPTVGAILGGAIAGLAGTGALAAGVLSTVKDERVQAAAKQAGHSIAEQFFSGGEALAEPVVDGIHIIEQAFTEMHVPDALAKLGPTVTTIAEGFAEAGKELMPGFNRFLDRIGPLADAGARGIADFGEAVGEALDNISNSPGTVEGLETALSLLSGTVRGLGKGLEFLGDTYDRWIGLQGSAFRVTRDLFEQLGLDDAAAGADRLTQMFDRMQGVGTHLHGTFRKLGTEAVDPFSGYLKRAWQEMDQLRGETEATRKSLVDYFDTLQGQLDANIAWEQAIDDLTASVLENGRTLDITTQAGRNNTRAFEEGLQSARKQYEQGQLTAAQYDQQIQKLIQIGVQAGLSRKELEALAKQYQIEILVKLLGPTITQGAGNFLAGAVATWLSKGASGQVNMGRPMKEYALGGVTPVGEVYKVHRDEMLFSDRSHYVATAAQVRAMAAPGGGGGTIRIIVQDTSGRTLRNQLISDAQMRGVDETTISAAFP